jgi:hypothetical protein
MIVVEVLRHRSTVGLTDFVNGWKTEMKITPERLQEIVEMGSLNGVYTECAELAQLALNILAWTKITDDPATYPKDGMFIGVWMDGDSPDSYEWYLAMGDDKQYLNMNSNNMNAFTDRNSAGHRHFTHWRPFIIGVDAPKGVNK